MRFKTFVALTVILRMATIGLLVGLTGLMPGAQTAAMAGQASTFPLDPVSSPGADAAQYSVSFQDIEPVRHVLPPSPPIPGLLGGDVYVSALDPVPGNEYTSLGSATVSGSSGLEQVLRLARVTVAPGGSLRLAKLGGSGLVMVESGWLKMTERSDTMVLVRAPARELPVPPKKFLVRQALSTATTIDAGDRIAVGSEATIVLRNRGERPTDLLTLSVVAAPGTAT